MTIANMRKIAVNKVFFFFCKKQSFCFLEIKIFAFHVLSVILLLLPQKLLNTHCNLIVKTILFLCSWSVLLCSEQVHVGLYIPSAKIFFIMLYSFNILLPHYNIISCNIKKRFCYYISFTPKKLYRNQEKQYWIQCKIKKSKKYC